MNRNILVTTTSNVENASIMKYLGVVSCNIVIGTNIISDLFASFSDFFGGYSGTYKQKLSLIYEKAQDELVDKAYMKGANCILNFHADFDEISSQGKSMFMIAVSGTAVVIQMHEQDRIVIAEAIDKEELTNETYRRIIINKVLKNNILPSEDDWEYIKQIPIPEIGKSLISSYIQIYNTIDDADGKSLLKANIIPYLQCIGYENATRIIYPVINDIPEKASEFIRKCYLFSPQKLYSMINTLDINKICDIIAADKEHFNKEDLIFMQKILEWFNSLPIIHKPTKKKGILGKEKDVWECSCGKTFDKESEYCPHCGKNKIGLTFKQKESLDYFSQKVESLNYLLNEK